MAFRFHVLRIVLIIVPLLVIWFDSGAQEYPAHLRIDQRIKELRKKDRDVNRALSLGMDMDRKVTYRNRISGLFRRFSTIKYADKETADLLLTKLILTCDDYQGHYDFVDGVGKKPQWHTGNYMYERTRFHGGTLGKWDEFIELQMERHLKFQQSQLFFSLPESRKLQYFRGAFRKDLDYFTSVVVRDHKSRPDLLKVLYEYQLAFKGALMFSEIKMKQRIEANDDPEVKMLFDEWQHSKDSLLNAGASLGSEDLMALKDRINELEDLLYYISETGKTLKQKSGEGATLGEAQNISRDKLHIPSQRIQKELKSNEISIEIIRFNNVFSTRKNSTEYLALILSGQSELPSMVHLPNGDEMENAGSTYYQNAIQFKLKNTKSYDLFWRSISNSPAVRDSKRIYFSGDGVYHTISLATLYNVQNEQYLSSESEIILVPNSRLIVQAKSSSKLRRKKRTGLLIGFPQYELKGMPKSNESLSSSRQIDIEALTRDFGEVIPMLPGTKAEIESIKKQFRLKKIKTRVFMREEASESNLMNHDRVDFLHVATHGYFLSSSEKLDVDSHPLLKSGLLFAGSQQTLSQKRASPLSSQDGVLTAYEAMALNLENTDLVVLSACETGKGDIQNMDGVAGFQRAMFVAGVRSVIMSLWKVDDQATSEFMIEFYENYLETQDQVGSFRLAQSAIRNKYEAPYYWGAFVLIGF